MIYTFRANEDLIKRFDRTVRQEAFLKDKKVTRNSQINKLIKDFVEERETIN